MLVPSDLGMLPAVLGAPGGAKPWSWRFEGHHISVNVTDFGSRGQVVAPLFAGANLAIVPGEPQAGHRLLAAEEDIAFELLHMLDARQRARALLSGGHLDRCKLHRG